MGRPALEVIWLNISDTFDVTAPHENGSVDLADICYDNDCVRLGRIFEGVYLPDKGINEDSKEESDLWLQLVEDKEHDWNNHLSKTVQEASKNEKLQNGRIVPRLLVL